MKRAIVVCPGRGSYTKETLNYLKTHHHSQEMIAKLDQLRKANQEPSISEMDQSNQFKAQIHTRGEHASALIYACAMSDFLGLDKSRLEVVACLGNSMGWYIAMAAAQALNIENGFKVINTMGSMMKSELIGGQVIYPIVDSSWQMSESKIHELNSLTQDINQRSDHELYPSIFLGGYRVWGGNRLGLEALMKALPPIENYPFQLINHGAFHTPMMEGISQKAFALLGEELFQAPKIPLIDGNGKVWMPWSTDSSQIRNYTLGDQVVKPYDFTRSLVVALKEFAPDIVILLGPGSNLGGAIAQTMISIDWQNLKNKNDFTQRQDSNDPVLLSVGRPPTKGN